MVTRKITETSFHSRFIGLHKPDRRYQLKSVRSLTKGRPQEFEKFLINTTLNKVNTKFKYYKFNRVSVDFKT